MKKIVYTLLITSLLFFNLVSCKLTTEVPNIIKGRWGYAENGSAKYNFTFKANGDYTHQYLGSDDKSVTFNGQYTMDYSSFDITTASGIIRINGSGDTGVEQDEFYFNFTASAEVGQQTLKLKSTTNDTVYNLEYWGIAI